MELASAFYIALGALLFLALSWRVIGFRRSEKVSVGDGQNKALIKAMRTQANCAEYVPIGMLLLVVAELQGLPAWSVHILGSTLLAGRVAHAIGFGRSPQIVPLRISGMLMTLIAIALLAIVNLAYVILL